MRLYLEVLDISCNVLVSDYPQDMWHYLRDLEELHFDVPPSKTFNSDFLALKKLKILSLRGNIKKVYYDT